MQFPCEEIIKAEEWAKDLEPLCERPDLNLIQIWKCLTDVSFQPDGAGEQRAKLPEARWLYIQNCCWGSVLLPKKKQQSVKQRLYLCTYGFLVFYF